MNEASDNTRRYRAEYDLFCCGNHISRSKRTTKKQVQTEQQIVPNYHCSVIYEKHNTGSHRQKMYPKQLDCHWKLSQTKVNINNENELHNFSELSICSKNSIKTRSTNKST